MPRVSTNNISLAFGIQSALGVDPTEWELIEPNDIGKFGAEIKTESRSPISKNRQRQKGTVTDLDSGVEFVGDLTLSHFLQFVEGFIFARAVNYDLVWRAGNTDATGITIAAASAAQGSKVQWTSGGPMSLIYNRGYGNSANNGLFAITGDVATSGTEIPLTGLTTETAPTNAETEVCGIRAESADLAITVASGVATITSGGGIGTAIDFTTLGLTVGQFIHVGGLTASEQFSAGAGYGRLVTIAAGTITLDKLDAALATDPGTGETIDLLFGRFIRNVSVDHADYIERYFMFEQELPNLGTGSVDMYQYAKDNLCNEMAFEFGLSSKASLNFGFIGTDTDDPVVAASRKSGASAAIEPTRVEAFNTTVDIARLRITEVDETGLTTDFKSITMNLKNNVTPEKVLAQLEAKYLNTGNFEIDLESEQIFSNSDVLARIRANTTVTMDFILKNGDGGVYVDIPSHTLGGGGTSYPVNESVLISVTCEAFKDATLDTSIGMSVFPVTP